MFTVFDIKEKIGDRVAMRKRRDYLRDKREYGVIENICYKNKIAVVETDSHGFIWQGSIQDFFAVWEKEQ